MLEKIKSAVAAYGFCDVKLQALVSPSMSSVVFYVTTESQKVQSNEMAENGLIDPLKLQAFESLIVSIVRSAKEYNPDKMNIVEFVAPSTIDVNYAEKNCRVYKIKKDWEERIRQM